MRSRWVGAVTISLLGAASMLGVAPASGAACAENPITAEQVRTRSDVEAFVRCAHEFLQEAGAEAAREAFHNDPRWRSGESYVFARTFDTTNVLSPPDQDKEGLPWGEVVDMFGSDIFAELNRVAGDFGEGWVYYSFRNPITRIEEPKASFIVLADWDGVPVHLGSGIYIRDVPGTCRADEISAAHLEASPTDENLREFVRCAALELERKGLFASTILASDPRWRSGSIYVEGINAVSRMVEFTGAATGPGVGEVLPDLGGRDTVGIGSAFGEVYLHATWPNPATGRTEPKMYFFKRLAVQGVPYLVASGYYRTPPSAR